MPERPLPDHREGVVRQRSSTIFDVRTRPCVTPLGLCVIESPSQSVPGSTTTGARTGETVSSSSRAFAELGTMRVPDDPRRVMGRAVVLGGSMAGLLAARVLSDHADQVVVIERDDIAVAGYQPRPGVPQGRHVHGHHDACPPQLPCPPGCAVSCRAGPPETPCPRYVLSCHYWKVPCVTYRWY
jgi:hypothetical protein